MGLDMYVTAKVYNYSFMPCEYLKDGIDIIVKKTKCLGTLDSLSFEFLYFRKVNWLHKWMVDNVQNGEDDCQPYEIDTELLEQVLSVIRQVMDDNSLAKDLLPTQSGFFFGDTRMEESYFEELKRVYDYISTRLEEYKKFKEENPDVFVGFFYQSSW